NKIELNRKRPSQVLVGTTATTFDDNGNPISRDSSDPTSTESNHALGRQLSLQFEQLQNVVFARMVNKVGDRRYWEQWAKSVAEIAERQIERISNLIANDKTHQQAFANFLAGLQKNINPSITQQEAVEMLSQHIITKPVFEALFEGYSFVKNNPISVSMQTMLDLLEAQAFEQDTETLARFYESVKMRASGIDNAEGKQRIIIELYDKFFKTAFPKMVEKLGIVYTPVEVVDFIIHSVNDVLKKEFGRSLSDENVNILDPFTGTGTFITRLLESGLIDKKDLARKYQHEIFANEIVLLAYYIAAVNIENAYHDTTGEADYKAFEGICLTDTFQLGETRSDEDLYSKEFPQNSERVQRQKKAPLTVIFGNPPYSIGQKSANDNAQNQSYQKLEAKIRDTHVARSQAGLSKSSYDSYKKAFRWSADRLDKNGGIVCFVSNGAWLDGNSDDGLRLTFESEFSSIYVLNLRGNQRTSGELSRKEGGKVFGSGSRTPIAVTLLVKHPTGKGGQATIHYHDIGDYLSREEKLTAVKRFSSVANAEIKWELISPNDQGDWISKRNNEFDNFIRIDPEKKFDVKAPTFFATYAIGISTNRDAWVYNFSQENVRSNMSAMIGFYNKERKAFVLEKKKLPKLEVKDFVNSDSKKISWTRALRKDAENDIDHAFKPEDLKRAVYRPFCKQVLYFDKAFIESPGLSSSFFPNAQLPNIVLNVTGIGASKPFSVLASNSISNLDSIEKSQCFPLYYYEARQKQKPGLFDEHGKTEFIQRDAITDFILERARSMYGNTIGKEDIFYYVYGFLHSPEYREKFANDLKKMLPRLPLVEDVRDFWIFSRLGKVLANLHINYETVAPYEGVKVTGDESDFYTVEKMRFPSKGQKNTILYNSKITISNIPAKAYSYVVNGKSAIEWIMERYQVTTHKESGIRNNPNDWADEVQKPRYILDLLLSVINVSVQTVDIVEQLPKISFEEPAA
ncbi:MAG TPA: type ISP restriction/modification enzyme, partial [Pyrinomonadaceae bacterium]|nr:type ISP restriction/modification enzyme [Pyrinomonadaceae bacterium]